MIKNGRPYSNENGRIDDSLITDRKQEEIDQIYCWVYDNLYPRKTALYSRTSYGIKHILQRDIGIYLTNNEFKDAMFMCGYEPVNPNKLNWCYCLSEKSPAFKINR